MKRAWMTLFLCVMTGLLGAGERFSFDGIEVQALPNDGRGGVLFQLDSEHRNGRVLPVLTWTEPVAGPMAVRTFSVLPRVERFSRAPFQLTLDFSVPMTIAQVRLLLEDRKGQVYLAETAPVGKVAEGPRTFDFNFAGDVLPGGDPGRFRQVNWPLRPYGVVIVPDGVTPPLGRIVIDSLVVPQSGEQVELALETGGRFQLLADEWERPILRLRNPGDQPLTLTGSLTTADAEGNESSQPVTRTLAAGESWRLPVAGEFRRQGFWKSTCRLTAPSGRELIEEFRCARMIPAGPTAEPATEFLFGLCGHPERFSRAESEQEAIAAGLCGAKILRMELPWKRLQPRPDHWNFTEFDRLVNAFAVQGVEVQAILTCDAPWAVAADYQPKVPGAPAHGGTSRPDEVAFAAYARKTAEHFQGRIRYFEIWNEPDLVVFVNYPAADYRKLLAAGYRAVHQGSPDARVMNGGIAFAESNHSDHPMHNRGILDELLADGGRSFDLFAFHGHGSFGNYRRQLDSLTEQGILHSDRPFRWYSNETAVSSADSGEREQAETLFKKLLYSWSRGAVGYNWYLLREKSYYPLGHHERHFGLITAEFEPKPAFVTYNMLANYYRGGRFLKTLTASDGVYALLFQRRDGDGLLALWSESGEHLLAIDGVPAGTVRVDGFGNETSVPVSDGVSCLQVTGTPFTLRLPGGAAAPVAAELLSPPQVRNGQVGLTLKNPTSRPMNWQVTATAGGTRSIVLRAGERRTLTFPRPAAETVFQLALTPEKGEAITMRYPLPLSPSEGRIAFSVNQSNRYHSLVPSAPGNENLYWQGVRDLSFDAELSSHAGELLLQVTVTDDHHEQPYRGSQVWKGDGLQLGLALPAQNEIWKLGLTRLADGSAEVCCWKRPDSFADPSSLIRLTVSRDEEQKRTRYRCAIPFRAVGLTPEKAASGFRFNLIANDNDGELREGFLAVAPGLGYQEDNSDYWPQVQLP